MSEPVRFVRFLKDGRWRYGLERARGIIPLKGSPFRSWERAGPALARKDITLGAPCRPSKIVAVGINYRNHADEMGHRLPPEPKLFLKAPSAIIGPGTSIACPPASSRVDYEAELGVVIGRRARNIGTRDALDCVLGYTCVNDVTARDLQKKDGQWTRAKSFDTFAPVGPAIVTGIDPSALKVESFLNGERRQSASTADLIFSVPELISFISEVMTLLPGDVIATGTPEGVGPMSPGDRVEIRISKIGSLVNAVGG